MTIPLLSLALVIFALCSSFAVDAAEREAKSNESKEPAPLKPDPPHLSHGSLYTESHALGDLPQLPRDRSPTDSSWSNNIALCAVSKDDNTTDLREWIQYYHWLGVDRVYLADNNDKPDPELSSQLHDFVDAGFLALRSDAGGKARSDVYWDCMRDHRHQHNWMAFFDTDEYLILRKPDTSLQAFLDNFRLLPGLSIHHIDMGSAARQDRPTQGGVLRHYGQCDPQPSVTIKTIANTYFLANIAPHPHNMEFRGDVRAVNERLTPVPWRNIAELPQYCQAFVAPTSLRLPCRPIPGASAAPASADNIALFHYITQSAADFVHKTHHFSPSGDNSDGDKDAWKFFSDLQKSASSSGGVCGAARELADLCCGSGFKYRI